MPDGRCDDDALRIRIAVPPALWINPHARISAKQGVRTGIERPALRPDRRQIGGERLLSLRRRELASLQHAQGYRILARIFPGMGRDQSHFLRPKDVEETAEREYPPNRHVTDGQPRHMTGWIATDFTQPTPSFPPF